MKHSKKILLIPIILFSLMATNVFAGDKDFTVKKGMYLGLSFDYNSLPGDFDDSSFYYTSTN